MVNPNDPPKPVNTVSKLTTINGVNMPAYCVSCCLKFNCFTKTFSMIVMQIKVHASATIAVMATRIKIEKNGMPCSLPSRK